MPLRRARDSTLKDNYVDGAPPTALSVLIPTVYPHFYLYGCVPYLLGRELGYVSFLSALQLHGILSQIPKAIHVATTGAPRTLVTRRGRFELFQLHPRMMNDGVEWRDAPGLRDGRAIGVATVLRKRDA